MESANTVQETSQSVTWHLCDCSEHSKNKSGSYFQQMQDFKHCEISPFAVPHCLHPSCFKNHFLSGCVAAAHVFRLLNFLSEFHRALLCSDSYGRKSVPLHYLLFPVKVGLWPPSSHGERPSGLKKRNLILALRLTSLS